MESNFQLEKAYKEWQHAINVFNNATDADDIDYAIYNLETKKRQYMRLLNSAKENASSPPQNQSEESISGSTSPKIKKKTGLIFLIIDGLKSWLDKFYVYEEDDFE